jgi:hypothetical protein
MRGCLGRGARIRRSCTRGDVRWLLMDYSLSYGHHGLRPYSTHLGEGTVSMGQATGPIYTCETTGQTRGSARCPPTERCVGLASENTKLQGRIGATHEAS